jgi:undecaprenyl-diphosphatase
LLGIVIGTVVYLIFNFIRHKVEYSSVRITANYTPSGYLVSDVQVITATLYATFVFISIYALIYISNNIL